MRVWLLGELGDTGGFCMEVWLKSLAIISVLK